jgi:hypothetical protein
MRVDDDGFLTIEGWRIPFADVVRIDLRRWQRKSIARVHCRRGDRPRVTVIDDWIYEGGDRVLAELQSRTGLSSQPTPAAGSAPEDADPAAAPSEPPQGDAPQEDARAD